MLSIVQSFAGCNPNNKSLTVSNNLLYYLSSSNVVVCDSKHVIDILHFKKKLSCISSLLETVITGDVEGYVFLIDKKNTLSYKLPSKIQDCQVFTKEKGIFCTLENIYLVNFVEHTMIELKVDYLISSVALFKSYIITGSIIGGMYIYEILLDKICFIEKIDAHTDLIKSICGSGTDLLATCSQDTNVKIWKYADNNFSLLQTLNGHSDWATSVYWNNSKLYSASSDKTVRVWEKKIAEANDNSDIQFYTCTDILGAASEVLNVSFINNKLIAHYKSGGIDKMETGEYYVSGHINEIKDVDWKHDFLISCSQDKTSRIFLNDKEYARPQTHGFSLTSVKFLFDKKFRFISAGQETILRTYEATQDFLEMCKNATDYETKAEIMSCLTSRDSYCISAYLSELNLTNEISYEPTDEKLSENYLSTHVFKELKKIYGHFFEIKDIAVCSSLILSCNRSAAKNFAGLFVWTIDGKEKQYIKEHSLGIQKIAISKNEEYVLTVGRDKLVCLYSIKNNNLACVARFYEHLRIVFDCGFSWDSKHFATCSRDGKIVLYDISTFSIIKTKEFACELTSLCFSTIRDIIAVGTDEGEVIILNYKLEVLSKLQVVGQKVNIVRFNQKGNKIAVGGSDNILRVLSVNNNK